MAKKFLSEYYNNMQIHKLITNSPSFKMKFRFEKLTPEGDWFGEDREFFNSTYQPGLIDLALRNVKPKNDVFVMRLGLPETDWEVKEKGNKLFYNYSYKMYVDIVRKGKILKTYDLSEKDVPLEIGNYIDKFEVHPKGPCAKTLDFIDNTLCAEKRRQQSGNA